MDICYKYLKSYFEISIMKIGENCVAIWKLEESLLVVNYSYGQYLVSDRIGKCCMAFANWRGMLIFRRILR